MPSLVLAPGRRTRSRRIFPRPISVDMASPVANAGVLDGDALIEESRNRAASRLGGRDRLASLLLGSLFAATATALALFAATDRSPAAWTIGLLVASYAVASRIDFEIGTGYAVPTQLLLIPMLVLLPVRIVPLC